MIVGRYDRRAVPADRNEGEKCVLVAVDAHFDQRLGLA